MDAAAAQEVFATRQKMSADIIGYAHQIKIDALAQLGDLLRVMPKATGVAGRDRKGKTRGSSGTPRVVEPPTYADLGLDKKTASVAQQLATLSRAPDRDLEALAGHAAVHDAGASGGFRPPDRRTGGRQLGAEPVPAAEPQINVRQRGVDVDGMVDGVAGEIDRVDERREPLAGREVRSHAACCGRAEDRRDRTR